MTTKKADTKATTSRRPAKLSRKGKSRSAARTQAATGTVLVLRTCNADMTSHGGFVWPESGPVAAPDWSPAPHCGNGLHGALWGEGNGTLLNFSEDAKWLVVEVAADSLVDLQGKVKFPRGNVMFCGSRADATQFIIAHGARGRAVIGASVNESGYGGTATAGYRGTATAGYGGTATAGDRGTATAGYGGTATAGDGGTATAGKRGLLTIAYWDGRASRRRIKIGYVGEDGIQPGVTYQLDEHHNFVAVNKCDK